MVTIEQIYANNLEKVSQSALNAACEYVTANKHGFDQMYNDLLQQTNDEEEAQRQLKEYIINYFVIPLTFELKGMFL